MAKRKLNEQEKKEVIAEMPFGELQFRRKLINFAIRFCHQEGDPQDQIPNYKKQLARIDSEIKKRLREARDQRSPDVTLFAKVGRMGAKTKF